MKLGSEITRSLKEFSRTTVTLLAMAIMVQTDEQSLSSPPKRPSYEEFQLTGIPDSRMLGPPGQDGSAIDGYRGYFRWRCS
jgi:hypothetical protein